MTQKLTIEELLEEGMKTHAAHAFIKLQDLGCPVKTWYQNDRGHFWIDSEESSSEESSSGNEDRFMQFDSSENEEEEMVDAQSFTTGSSAAPKNTYKKRPMIQEIASVDFNEEEKD